MRPQSPPSLFNTFARHIALPINDAVAGTDIVRRLRFFEKSQWWSPVDLQEYQDRRLRGVIERAYSTVPYYHDLFCSLGLSPSDIRTADDLLKLPVLTKDEVRQNPDSFLSRDVKKSTLIENATSGSTGQVFRFYTDRTNLSVSRAIALRAWNFSGYRVGDRMVTLAGSALLAENMSGSRKLQFALSRNMPLSSYHLDEKSVVDYISRIERFQPKYLRGYPTSIALLAEHVLERKLDTVHPVGIMTTAETLSKQQRSTISAAFGCEVFDQFGCLDGGAHACECDHHAGYHIAVERAVHEFLDMNGDPVAPGEEGRIVLTDLWNDAMPLIRYDAGDMGVPGDGACSCGRGLPLLEKVTGRTFEHIVLPDGRLVPSMVLTDVFEHGKVATAIADYQVVQEAKDRFIVILVANKDYAEGTTDVISQYMKEFLGFEPKITFSFVEEIPRTRANKRTIVVSRVDR